GTGFRRYDECVVRTTSALLWVPACAGTTNASFALRVCCSGYRLAPVRRMRRSYYECAALGAGLRRYDECVVRATSALHRRPFGVDNDSGIFLIRQDQPISSPVATG